MKFKMAEKSLFAILLRSPWWISLLVALALVAVCRALLPENLWLFGAVGALPILVVGAVAFWRQLRAPSPAQVEALLGQAQAMKPREFTAAMAEGWRSRGFTAQVHSGEGADLVLEKDGVRSVVALRRWKLPQLGVEPLRELLAAREAADARHAVCAVTGELSAPARAFVKAEGIQLIGAAEVAALMAGPRR